MSRADMDGHSRNPRKSFKPSPPILFLFNCKFWRLESVPSPYIFDI